jgi:hypothetical protein
MADSNTRRQFLRVALHEVLTDRRQSPLEAELDTESRLQPLQAPTRCATVDELLAFAAEHALEPHAAAIAALAKFSWRLTSSVEDAGSPSARVWSDLSKCDVDAQARRNMPLATLDRAACETAGMDLLDGLQAGFDATSVLDGAWPPVRCDALFDARSFSAAGRGTPVAAHRELVLPRAWSAPVQRLELTSAEHDGWERLRQRLAVAQGTELPQGDLQAVHRLFGYPDERQGLMPQLCETATPDIPADRWVLVLQVTLEPVPAVPMLHSPRRAYLWADGHAVHDHDVARAAHVIVQ